MCDSSRPYPGMSVLPIPKGSMPRRCLALAAMLVVPALLATPVTLLASVHHAVAPVHRAVAHGPVSHAAAPRRGAHDASPAVAAHHIPLEDKPVHGHAAASSRRGGRDEEDTASARQGLGARAGRHAATLSHGRIVAREEDDFVRSRRGSAQAKAERRKTPAGRASRRPGVPSEEMDSRQTAGSRHTDPTVKTRHDRPVAADDTAAENPADRRTQDRVHAWYRTQDIATNVAPVSRPAAARSPAAPDLATAPHKATAADFARAADAQRQTIRSAADQNSRQTTAADDAADAETHIPSTAPTEREPAPFVHGDAPVPPVAASSTSRRTAAPIVRQRPAGISDGTGAVSPGTPFPPFAGSTAKAGAATRSVDLSPPAALTTQAAPAIAPLDLHPRVTSALPAARPAGGTDAAVLGTTPLAIAADSSPRAIRAIAAETAAAATPRVQLPSPPVAGRRPAIAAIQAGSARPMLDPAVTAGMADETFDGDNVPATANTAIRLATTGTAKVRAHAVAEPDDDTASTRVVVPVNLFDGSGHLLLLPPMKGTHEILVHQNQMAVADGLERIQNDSQLAEMRRTRLLVALPDDDSVYPNDVLPLNRRFARPWTVRFMRDLARAHYARFGSPLIVTSAARTVEFQRRLVRVNGNAAPPTGDIASPHLYGQAIDLAKHGMSLTEITWMRAYLAPVEDEGKIDVEEEFQQACFHISVYRRYLGAPPPKTPAAPPALLQAKSTPALTPAPEKKQHHLPTALLATHLP